MYKKLWQLLEKSQDKLALVQKEYLLASDKYQQLRDDILPLVEHWEWSSSLPRYSLDPLYFLDDSSRRGRAAKKEPISASGKKQYGFDMSGRIIAARNYTEFLGQFYEDFFVYETSKVTSYLFDYNQSKLPINCNHLYLSSGVPASLYSQAKYGHSSSIYVSEGNKIKYFCSLHSPDGRQPFGGCGEIVFPNQQDVELWDIPTENFRRLAFRGKQECYNTLLST